MLQGRGVQRPEQTVESVTALRRRDGTCPRRSRDGAHRSGAGRARQARWIGPSVSAGCERRRSSAVSAGRADRRSHLRRDSRAGRGPAGQRHWRGVPRHHPRRCRRGIAEPAACQGISSRPRHLGRIRRDPAGVDSGTMPTLSRRASPRRVVTCEPWSASGRWAVESATAGTPGCRHRRGGPRGGEPGSEGNPMRLRRCRASRRHRRPSQHAVALPGH